MGYKIGDIYRSSQFSKVESWNTLRERSYLFDKDLMVTILTREIEKLKVHLNMNKNTVHFVEEGLIKSNSGNISKLELDLKKSHTEKTKYKINKNIEGLKLSVDQRKKELESVIEQEESLTNDLNELNNNIDIEHLKRIYFERYRKIVYYRNKAILNNKLSLLKEEKSLGKRPYSTLISSIKTINRSI